MNCRRVASSLALACFGVLVPSQCRARRAARRHRTVHQPGLLVLSARRQAARRIARDPSLIAMSLPVDYWDYLGWKDTLALRGHTNRQRAYAQGARRPRGLHAAGRRSMARRMCSAATRPRSSARSRRRGSSSSPLSLPVDAGGRRRQADGHGAGRPRTKRAKAEVWLCPITKSVPVTIGRGENSGHTITYTTWCGAGSSSATGPARPRHSTCRSSDVRTGDIDAVAVMVQSGVSSAPKLMLGARDGAALRS